MHSFVARRRPWCFPDVVCQRHLPEPYKLSLRAHRETDNPRENVQVMSPGASQLGMPLPPACVEMQMCQVLLGSDTGLPSWLEPHSMLDGGWR